MNETLPNTTGEVMWSCNVTANENEREKCESLCTISNAQHKSIFSGACIPDICRNSVCDSSISLMHNINLALHFVYCRFSQQRGGVQIVNADRGVCLGRYLDEIFPKPPIWLCVPSCLFSTKPSRAFVFG